MESSRTRVREQVVEYPGKGVALRAFVASPRDGARHPGIVVVQEWWGLNEHIQDVGRRLAQEGYVAIVPDLYSRFGHTVVPNSDSKEAGRMMATLKQDDGLADLNATVDQLRKTEGVDAKKIGVIGFCMGGSYALMLACINPAIKAAVPFYGQVPNPDTPLESLHAPVLYIYGEEDGWITKADVHRLAGALKKYGKKGDIKTYPGAAHAFFNDTRPEVYRSDAAQDAWKRALEFFKANLAA
jgi:carboxymethylenebutenolidase